jgi:5,10-methenyltetrahydromethanopterin hydrogenase
LPKNAPQTAPDEKVETTKVHERQIAAIIDMEIDIEIVREHAKRNQRNIERRLKTAAKTSCQKNPKHPQPEVHQLAPMWGALLPLTAGEGVDAKRRRMRACGVENAIANVQRE